MGSRSPNTTDLQGENSTIFCRLGLIYLQLTGYHVPELVHVVSPMLNERPEARPSSLAVLKAFDKMVPLISEERLETKLRGHGLH